MRASKANAIDNFLVKGNELISQAITADNKKSYREAFDLYMVGLECLENARKYEKCEPKVKAIVKKMGEYLERAEVLKAYLKEASEAPSAPSGHGTSTGTMKKEEGAQKNKNDADVDISKIVVTTSPNVTFDQIVGLENTKKIIEAALIWPTKYGKFYEANKTQPMNSMLLYGPPGTGKTQLAKAVATEMKSCFITVNSSDVMTKWQGESEQKINLIFKVARERAPTVIFFDEVDGLFSSRNEGSSSETSNKVKNEILVNMSGFQQDAKKTLFIMAATNNPGNIDIAFVRRFEQRLYIPLPEEITRKEMFRKKLLESVNALTDDDYAAAAKATENYSGADIETVVKHVKESALRKYADASEFVVEDNLYIPAKYAASADAERIEMTMGSLTQDQMKVLPIVLEDLLLSIEKNKPSISVADLKKYESYTATFGQSGK